MPPKKLNSPMKKTFEETCLPCSLGSVILFSHYNIINSMIPTEEQAKKLWDKYQLPDKKRLHVSLVARVAMFLAGRWEKKYGSGNVNKQLLLAAALLHDIDKAIPRAPGEQHPDTAVRVLQEEGADEVAAVVKRHPLHAILDPEIAPQTIEEKFLYLSDKMVKFKIIDVDRRFQLWRDEQLPFEARETLERCYPKVKLLEQEILSAIDLIPSDVAKLA